ncbi:hypothetical protein F4818DRAFT_435838 [Hypoxylon cercidicola]|nr:hypothetical protein F4818DRAFT_435838 [Hypoxylon cercidicola]
MDTDSAEDPPVVVVVGAAAMGAVDTQAKLTPPSKLNLQINKAFDSLRTQPAQPPQPEQHAQHGQPTQQGGKVATKKNIQALKRQHDELTATLEDRKKHLDSLTEDITLASAKLEQIRDINKQHAKKEEELNEKERELVQREQELEDKKAVAELKTTQYKSLLNTIALAAQPDIIACIDKIIEFYYELLKHEVHKAEEEHGKLLSTTDLYYCLFAQSETMTQENEQLRARLQSLEDNTPR